MDEIGIKAGTGHQKAFVMPGRKACLNQSRTASVDT